MEKFVVEGNEILANNKPVAELSAIEFEKLLLMHQIPKAKMGNKHNKLVKWKEILLSKKLPPSFDIWSSKDEAALNDLQKSDIKLYYTALGRQATIEKIKLKAAINTMDINKLKDIEDKAVINAEAEEVVINAEATGTSGDHDSMDGNEGSA